MTRLVRGVGWAVVALGLIAAAPPAPHADQVAEAPKSTIGYPTAEAALAALRAKPGVTFAAQDGWTIATDDADNAVWSFPPEHDPAFPAVVRRQMTPGPKGSVSVQMDVLC